MTITSATTGGQPSAEAASGAGHVPQTPCTNDPPAPAAAPKPAGKFVVPIDVAELKHKRIHLPDVEERNTGTMVIPLSALYSIRVPCILVDRVRMGPPIQYAEHAELLRICQTKPELPAPVAPVRPVASPFERHAAEWQPRGKPAPDNAAGNGHAAGRAGAPVPLAEHIEPVAAGRIAIPRWRAHLHRAAPSLPHRSVPRK